MLIFAHSMLQCLLEKGGYTFLDVRPPIELEESGRVAGAVNIPLVHVSVLTGFCFYVVICLNIELGRQVSLVHVKLSQALNWVWGLCAGRGGGKRVGGRQRQLLAAGCSLVSLEPLHGRMSAPR